MKRITVTETRMMEKEAQKGLELKNQLDRIEQMLRFIICRMPYVTFDAARPEDAPDIGGLFPRRR